jgi:catechol 2,3-dioxygenase-like lactoylglutathione lyase family enzyme
VLEGISAVTLTVSDMARSVDFYQRLGFVVASGGSESDFTTFRVGGGCLNLTKRPGYTPGMPWGRVIFYVSDVDEAYRAALAAGLEPSTAPRDAEWRERYFHILDPDGHELSFAKPL